MTLPLIAALAFITASTPPPAEELAKDSPATWDSANSVFVEFVGSAPIGSLNYERRFARRWGVRVGLGYLPDITLLGQTGAPTVFGLLGGNWIWPRGPHAFEGGVTVALGAQIGKPLAAQDLVLGLIAGYRFTNDQGVLFRISLTPLFALFASPVIVLPLIGLSLGYAF
jgi:hypothetical protein